MKKALPILALLSLAMPLQTQAKPVFATLYPSGAMVTEEEFFRPEEGRISLSLPAGADAESLCLFLSEGRVQELRIRTKNTPSPAMQKLRQKREELESALDKVAAEAETLAFERNFWANPPVNFDGKDKKDVNGLFEETKKSLADIAERDADFAKQKRELKQRIKDIDARMEDVGRHNDTVQECVLFLENDEPVTIRWTYFLKDASWQPRYRVLAEEKEKKIKIAMDAVLHQASGADWEGVNITLASANTSGSAAPAPLPHWIIGEERRVFRAFPRMYASEASEDMAAELKLASTDGAIEQEHAAGILRRLGKVNLPAHGSIARPAAAHEFSADIFRLARPALGKQVWIAAEINEKDMPVLPAGQALFLIDGTENARGVFRMEPGKKEIFFGVDQLMLAEEKNMPAETAAAADKDIRKWKKSLRIDNGHDKPMRVRVEAASPIARDASVKVEFTANPKAKAQEGSAVMVWNIEVPAKKSAGIAYEVTVTQPADKKSGNKGN